MTIPSILATPFEKLTLKFLWNFTNLFFVLISHLLYHCSNEFAEIIIKCITNCINNDLDYSDDLDDFVFFNKVAGLSLPPENVRNPFVKNETFGTAVFLWIFQNF